MKKRVVITGISTVTAIGCEINKFWENLLAGTDGISDLSIDGLEECYCKRYGLLDREEIKALQGKLLSDEEKKLSACSRLALTAAIAAVNDAGICFDTAKAKMNTGVMLGTTQADQYAFTDGDEALINDRFTAPLSIAKHFDIHGETFLNANLCASGNHAAACAYDLISAGRLDAAIVGGVDVFSTITYVGFNRLKALSPDTVKPFDTNRNGTILSEGAALFVFEELGHALKRNAHIYGEVIGCGISNDAYNIVAPDPEGKGVISAMERAIENSGISYMDVDFIALHGTGTAANDSAEVEAVRKVFGDHTENIYATAIKGTLGHQLGAASAVAMAVCTLILKTGKLPPTVNISNTSDLGFQLIKEKSVSAKIDVIMNNAYAFGGSNCCVIIRRWKGN